MLRYALLVCGPAYGSERSACAWQFAKALGQSQHQLTDVFFYQDGVYNASQWLLPATDEVNMAEQWLSLAQQQSVKLHICSSAAMRRGMIDQSLAQQYQFSAGNIHPVFCLTGLTELAQLILHCDRVIQF